MSRNWGPEMTSANTSDDRKRTKPRHRCIDVVVLFFFFVYCLLGVRVRTLASNKQEKEQKDFHTAFTDDSAQQLRDKEQQRLSSK